MMLLNATGAAVLFLCGTLPIEDVVVESVDLIEINHCYDEEGKHVFDQVLFYDWSTQDKQYHVRWTQHDPEVAARSQLPKELRRELLRPSSTLNSKVVGTLRVP